MTRRRFVLRVEEKPADADVKTIVDGLRAFNTRQVGAPPAAATFAVTVRDGAGLVVGGLVGVTYWDWMYVDYLWLDDGLRRRGWGRRLVEEAERVGRGRGCKAAWLDTFSFQAPGFYRRMGYEEFGSLHGHPHEHARHFFWKPLGPARQGRRTPARRR